MNDAAVNTLEIYSTLDMTWGLPSYACKSTIIAANRYLLHNQNADLAKLVSMEKYSYRLMGEKDL